MRWLIQIDESREVKFNPADCVVEEGESAREVALRHFMARRDLPLGRYFISIAQDAPENWYPNGVPVRIANMEVVRQ